MKYLSVRTTSRLVCAAGTLLGLTLLTGINAPQAQARLTSAQAARVTLTSVSAPTQFNSGDNISVEVGLAGGSAQVHVTSLPAGIVDYTTTVSGSTPFTVPTTATVPGASSGDNVSVTLKVTVGQQTVETTSEVTATRSDLEPIFPKTVADLEEEAEAEADSDLEPIFPKPATRATRSDLEPIFPKTVADAEAEAEAEADSDLEPIFPKPVARATRSDLEPIFPKPTSADTYGDSGPETDSDLEPIFPKPLTTARYASRLHSFVSAKKARTF